MMMGVWWQKILVRPIYFALLQALFLPHTKHFRRNGRVDAYLLLLLLLLLFRRGGGMPFRLC